MSANESKTRIPICLINEAATIKRKPIRKWYLFSVLKNFTNKNVDIKDKVKKGMSVIKVEESKK